MNHPLFCRWPLEFQSTLPAWGETLPKTGRSDHKLISIHSPRMGRDDLLAEKTGISQNFNPLSPHGERRETRPSAWQLCAISIHSPRMGRDCNSGSIPTSRRDFNPLSPHGERPRHTCADPRKIHFNPLSLHGERPVELVSQMDYVLISIHSPCMGRDTIDGVSQHAGGLFQSTLPAWGETYCCSMTRFGRLISIHSPCMGRDSRHKVQCQRLAISIHSPCMGRDAAHGHLWATARYFNPLSLHGERR